jgi:hypothetical protein
VKPHERLFVAVGFLTLLVLGASLPADPEEGTTTWIDKVFVGGLILACALWAVRALLDMSYTRQRRQAYHPCRKHYYRLDEKNK